MAAGKMLTVVMAIVILAGVGLGEQSESVGTQVHHVIGGDRGWDPSSDLASWSSARIFKVGDKIWFAYSAAQGKIVELKSSEEFESCDVSNPIRMYTDGLDGVSLDREGIRYFASSNQEYCKNGLKVPVEVQPKIHSAGRGTVGAAEAPSTPSVSSRLAGVSSLVAATACLIIAFHY